MNFVLYLDNNCGASRYVMRAVPQTQVWSLHVYLVYSVTCVVPHTSVAPQTKCGTSMDPGMSGVQCYACCTSNTSVAPPGMTSVQCYMCCTSNTSVAPPGISGGAPVSPYPRSEGITCRKCIVLTQNVKDGSFRQLSPCVLY